MQNNIRRFRLTLLLAVFLLQLGSVAAVAQTPPAAVPVKIGTHDSYTRVVFEFPKLLAYHPKSSDGNLRIVFDTKAALAVAATKSPLIKSITTTPNGDDTVTADISLAAGATFKHYRLQRKIVVDIYPAGGSPVTPDKPAAVAEKKPMPEKKEAAPAVAPAAPPVPQKTESAAVAEKAPVSETTPAPPSPPLTESPGVLSDPADIAAVKLPQIPLPEKAKPALPVTADAAVTPALVDVPPEELPENAAKITLSSLLPLKLAVFERFNALWVVTDSIEAGVSPPTITGPMSGMIGGVKSFKFEGGTAYRYTLPKKVYPVVKKQNLAWEISLLETPLKNVSGGDVKIEFDQTSRRAKILAPLEAAGSALTFEDPSVGDVLLVVPSSRADQGIKAGRRFVDLEVLPSLTGLVVRPLREGIAARPANGVVLLSSTDGLAVTPEGVAPPVLVGSGADPKEDIGDSRLFDFPNWRQGGIQKFQENRREIQEQIITAATPEDRVGMLMKMALLYFSNHFGQEALGLLSLIQQENPELEKNMDFIAIRGAANAMSGNYTEALQDLSTPAIQQNPEVKLWIGFAAAASEQWRMANRSFPKSNRILLQYPDDIAIPFTIYMAESALRLGHTDTAKQLLDSININSETLEAQYQAAIGYLKGETFSQEGDLEAAAAEWKPVADGLDRLYHTKASLSLTRMLLGQKKITLKEAIDRIDSLRFAWRGDGLEVTILHTLGTLKVQNNQVLSGLQDMKQAAELSDSLLDDSTQIRDDMKRVFADMFVGDQAGKVPPLEAVSVYDEFTSLMPEGLEGTAATLSFADYLIHMDLLERAAEMIESQIQKGLPETRVSGVGTKLAAVYLLDGRPARALEALRETERAGLPDKAREERTLLKARAQSQLNQTAAAISTLSVLGSKNAQRLKADVLWRAQKWNEAAEAIEVALPAAGKPISEDDALLVVNAAVARKLAGNPEGLKAIREKYESAVASTKQAAVFGVVTRDGGDSSLSDRESALKIAGEVDMFKGFLESYKTAAGSGS